MNFEKKFRGLARWATLLLIPLMAACVEDENLMPPEASAGSMFSRYVAIGNSITAGFQSGGINKSTQMEAYPLLLAEQFGLDLGEEFFVPFLNAPGCPPPFTDIFTGARLNGGSDTDCAFRESPIPVVISNVAVPGAAIADVLSNSGAGTGANALTQMILGGRTQIQAVRDANPSFVSVWVGNNDVLGAATTGDASGITTASNFTTRYNNMMQELDAIGVQGGVLLGVVDVVNIPHLSPGVAYFGAAQQGALPPTFNVDLSCAPSSVGGIGDQVLVPFGYGFGVLLAQASQGITVTLNCATDPPVLSQQEIVDVSTAVAAYNQTIQQAAGSRSWAFLDPNPLLEQLAAQGQIPLFPDPTNPSEPFGPWLSLDGIHPSGATHELVADAAIDAINQTYGTNISGIQ